MKKRLKMEKRALERKMEKTVKIAISTKGKKGKREENDEER